MLRKSTQAVLLALLLLGVSMSPAAAQKDAREILRDHSTTLRAGDLTLTFIYLNRSAPEIASQVLTTDEFERWSREIVTLQDGYSLIVVRVTPFRDARFDPTQITFTQRENSQPIGFMDVVDVSGMFNSTVERGDNITGFLKVSDRIDWRQSVVMGYESYRTEFSLPTKWKQKYFQFLDGRPPPD